MFFPLKFSYQHPHFTSSQLDNKVNSCNGIPPVLSVHSFAKVISKSSPAACVLMRIPPFYISSQWLELIVRKRGGNDKISFFQMHVCLDMMCSTVVKTTCQLSIMKNPLLDEEHISSHQHNAAVGLHKFWGHINVVCHPSRFRLFLTVSPLVLQWLFHKLLFRPGLCLQLSPGPFMIMLCLATLEKHFSLLFVYKRPLCWCPGDILGFVFVQVTP